MRKVILNSTPIISLAKLNLLPLLQKMYAQVTIPETVYEEVTRKNDIVKRRIDASPWIHIETVHSRKNERMYRAKLHKGEVEVMILAQECEGEHLVVIDDDAARKTASFLGLTLTGTIGILIKAKELGYIEAVMPMIALLQENGIYFSNHLIDRIKQLSQEEQNSKA